MVTVGIGPLADNAEQTQDTCLCIARKAVASAELDLVQGHQLVRLDPQLVLPGHQLVLHDPQLPQDHPLHLLPNHRLALQGLQLHQDLQLKGLQVCFIAQIPAGYGGRHGVLLYHGYAHVSLIDMYNYIRKLDLLP